MGQGQPNVIISTFFVVLAYTMLHTQFQGHQFIGFGDEDCQGFDHIWAWGDVGHVLLRCCFTSTVNN